MKGVNLGELEELILLVVANLGQEAYGLSIRDYILKHCDRSISISTVHSTIHRLEQKGYLRSAYDNTRNEERGGRPKLIFTITAAGKNAAETNRAMREKLWLSIPSTI